MNIKFKNMKFSKAFTLIELLIAIAIISLLAGVVVMGTNSMREKARDSKRKAQLLSIKVALDKYYGIHGKYPQAGTCAYGSNCYVYSTAGSNWIPALAAEAGSLPVDPINVGGAPWAVASNNYTYAYGNVSVDGQQYDLTGRLENKGDPDRCEVKNYTFYFTNQPWCGAYSKQIYEVSP